MAIDVAAFERIGDRQRRAIGTLVSFLPGNDDAIVVHELAADVIEARRVVDDGQDVTPRLLGSGKRDAAPTVSLAAAFDKRETHDRARREEGDDATMPSLGCLTDGLSMRSPLEMPCTSVRSGQFLERHVLDAATRYLELVNRDDLDLPALAASGDSGDVLALLDAAYGDVMELLIGEGEGDDIAFGQFAFHEKTRYGHVHLPLGRVRKTLAD